MRAVVCREFGPLDLLELADMPAPEATPGAVVVDVHAAGVNFPDLLMVQGLYQARPDLPFIPGAEGAGVVAAVGGGVSGVSVGDEVMFVSQVGAFAEQCAVDGSGVMPIPEGLTMEQAAGFTLVYGTAYHALVQRGGLAPGETLLVLGAAGGVGSAAVELGKALGAQVIAAASTAEKLEFATELGADHVINYATHNVRDGVREAGLTVDVVFDPVGGDIAEPALRTLGWDGRYLVVGFAAGGIPKIPLNLTLLKGLHVVGVFWGAWVAQNPGGSAGNQAALAAMVRSGAIRPRVTEIHALEDFAEAFTSLAERRARGKVVLSLR